MRVDISSFQCMVVEKKTHIAKRMTSLEPTDGGDVAGVGVVVVGHSKI